MEPCPSFEVVIEDCDDVDGGSSQYRKDREPCAGYPGVAHFMNSHPDFLVFRRFGQLSVRNILYIQDELQEIEEKLWNLEAEKGLSKGRRTDEDVERNGLMALARERLLDYEKAIKFHEWLISFEHAPERRIKSVENYLNEQVENRGMPEAEASFIKKRHDLVALHPVGRQTLFRLLDSKRLFERLFPKTKNKLHTGVVTYSQTPMASFYRLLSFLMIWVYVAIFIIMPIILLAGPFVEITAKWKVLFVAIIVLVFSAALSLFTAAKDWELLAATAAYSAVLVVFLGNGSGNSNSN